MPVMMHRREIMFLFAIAHACCVFLSTDAERVDISSAERLFVVHLRAA